MDNHYKKRQAFRLETHREQAILSIGVHLAPPGDLSLIRYPVSCMVKIDLMYTHIDWIELGSENDIGV